jgi:hypothetical protein
MAVVLLQQGVHARNAWKTDSSIAISSISDTAATRHTVERDAQ